MDAADCKFQDNSKLNGKSGTITNFFHGYMGITRHECDSINFDINNTFMGRNTYAFFLYTNCFSYHTVVISIKC